MIIHRDVKPENLLIEEDIKTGKPNLCIADFGLSVFEKTIYDSKENRSWFESTLNKHLCSRHNPSLKSEIKVANQRGRIAAKNLNDVEISVDDCNAAEEAKDDQVKPNVRAKPLRRRHKAGNFIGYNDQFEEENPEMNVEIPFHSIFNPLVLEERLKQRTGRNIGTKKFMAPEIVSFDLLITLNQLRFQIPI